MLQPLVTIIIPYKTDRGYLDVAIESVRKQTYPNIELIIQQGDKSVSANINDGIRKAKGEYIKYLCEDDYLTPNSIADSVKAMQGFDFIHGVSYNIKGKAIETQVPRLKYPSLSDMLIGNVIHGGTLMYRKDVFDKVGLFNEDLTCAEEYEFNLRCLRYGLKLGYTDRILYNYRRHDEQKSLGKGIDQQARAKKIQAIKDSVAPLKIVVCMATYGGRDIKPTLNSLKGQADVIRIYDNANRSEDLTDLGKFYFLQEYTEPIYYLTVDDDIIYPPTYVRDMVRAIDLHKTIVTHHGRKLTRKGISYYKGHNQYAYNKRVGGIIKIDVAGTGVCGFRTDYFNPLEVCKSEHHKMSDLVFSLEARKQGKLITLLPHNSNYFKTIQYSNTIFNEFLENDSVQTTLADEILGL